LDDAFTLKEVILYLGGLAALIAGWFWAYPMQRLSGLEKIMAEHIRTNAMQHQECKIEVLQLRNHVTENYPNKAEYVNTMNRVYSKLDDIFELLAKKADKP